ncbi:MAG: hypothetical protein CVU88_03430, partial [Firmicutes bacterium HGW-Firmicutes-13]
LIECKEEKVIFLGDALERYGEIINQTLGIRAFEAPPSLRVNRAALTAQLGLERFKTENNRDNYLKLQPLYLRRSEAEVKWEKRQKGVETIEAKRACD